MSRGIGLSIVKLLLAHESNPRVVGISRSEPQDSSILANSNFHLVSGSAADEQINKQAVDLAVSKYGRLDGVIANAGVLDAVQTVENADLDQWRSTFEVNLMAPLMLIKHALPHLHKTKGAVVVTSSGAAKTGYKTWAAYGGSKAAVNLLTSTVAVENPDIFAIAVAPGVVDTEMQREIREIHIKTMPADLHRRYTDLKANRDLVSPDVPAAVIANLTLEKPMQFSGQFVRYSDEEMKPYLK